MTDEELEAIRDRARASDVWLKKKSRPIKDREDLLVEVDRLRDLLARAVVDKHAPPQTPT
tara:strand:+ start:1651 stop:1830 length:180 start_codon:yes stop_codon:yes gene_type:complete